jgi:hypothetical protein
MPGWYIHMDAARAAISGLEANPRAAAIFGADTGPSAAELRSIVENNSAYFALGAIGPDIFFLLPDFKPPTGTALWGAANLTRGLFQWWDDNFLGPYESELGPIAMNSADQVDALTGGLASTLTGIFSRAAKFLRDFKLVLITRQYDIYGFLGSGAQNAFDEQTFFWSDMLHYRKTYDFAHRLWTDAVANGDDGQKAFALGWMSHLATDVTGHCFVNEKCGGPYRLHWQRHHLIENHMDAKVYDSEHGGQDCYNMLSCSALHLWIKFNPDGTSKYNCLTWPQPLPNYQTGDKTPDILDRKSLWDQDSVMPQDLADFIASALKAVYNDSTTATNVGANAGVPKIIQSIVPSRTDGYPTGEDIVNTYWWLYKYVRWTTTDYYKIRRPEPPDVIIIQPFPSPPGSGDSDPGPGAGSTTDTHDDVDHALAILAWLEYIVQCLEYPVTVLIGIITSAGTAPIREVLYETLEVPLYNAWLTVHWYLAMTGFVMPMASEINPGLMTLGCSVLDTWAGIEASLADLYGGLQGTINPDEPSGHGLNLEYPRDVCMDSATLVQTAVNEAFNRPCAWDTSAPSEFTRPWRFPLKNNAGVPLPVETPLTVASPYTAMQDATVLLGNSPGDNDARINFESCASEGATILLAQTAIANNQHLGNPVDYSAYLMARLTRDDAGDATHLIRNFNLDSDRGYGYLCWDWLRSPEVMAVPTPYFRGLADQRVYHAPVAPGTGWCKDDIAPPPPAGGTPSIPANAPTMQGKPNPRAVRIRYIDKQPKY